MHHECQRMHVCNTGVLWEIFSQDQPPAGRFLGDAAVPGKCWVSWQGTSKQLTHCMPRSLSLTILGHPGIKFLQKYAEYSQLTTNESALPATAVLRVVLKPNSNSFSLVSSPQTSHRDHATLHSYLHSHHRVNSDKTSDLTLHHAGPGA